NLVFDSEEDYGQITGTSFTLPSANQLQQGKQYRWNMRAFNSAGYTGSSNSLYFYYEAAPSLPSGIDTATDVSGAVDCLRSKDILFVGRYFSTYTWKTIKREEAQKISAAGMYIVSIWQESANYPEYFSYYQGKSDGKNAYEYAAEIGQSPNTPVYFAVDFDATSGHKQRILDYFRGVKDGYEEYLKEYSVTYEIGVYGSYWVLYWLKEQGIATYFYQAYAPGWSGGENNKPWPDYEIRQVSTPQTLCGIEVDHDDASSQFGGWSFTTGQPSVAKLVITSPLQITPGKDKYYVSDLLTANLTIKNIGGEPITLDKLIVGGRFNEGKLPNGKYPDFSPPQSLTLSPGQPHTYEGTLELTAAGNYHFFCAYQTPDGEWNTSIDLGPGLTDEDRVKDVKVLLPEGPYISYIEPSSGAPGIEVTIKGFNFGDMDLRNKGVEFEWEREIKGAAVTSWSNTEIVVEVPPGRGKEDTVNVYVVYGGGFKRSKNSVEFTYVKPSINPIESTEPKAGPPGERVAIKGANFGFVDRKDLDACYYSHIRFGNSQLGIGDIDSWTDNEIVIRKTPSDYGTGIGDAAIIKDLVELATLGIIKGTISIADVGKSALSKLIPNLVTLELKEDEEWWKSYAKIMAALGIPGVEVRPEADKGGLIWMPVTVETSAGKDETGLFAYVIPLSIVSTTPPCLIGTSLPSQPTGSDYTVTFDAVGGIPPYKWSVSAELPPGLQLDPSTGVLIGTLPPTPKTYEFTITVQDNGQAKGARVQTVSKQFSLEVTPPSAWRVIPNWGGKLPDQDSFSRVTIIGTGFTSPVKLDFGDGVTVHSAWVIDNNHVEAHISISKDAPTGKRDVLITFPASGLSVKIPKGFEVQSPTYLGPVAANPEYLAWIHSPAELRVYDSQNRVTGLVNGEVREEIPNSSCHSEGRIVIISSATDSYRYEVVGTGGGTYGLEIISINSGNVTTFAVTDIPTSAKATHQYTINWDTLSRGGEEVTAQIDSDGDDVFEETRILQPPSASFTFSPSKVSVNESINLDASQSSDADGQIVLFQWNFGDGNTSTGSIVTHAYSLPGEYLVSLVVVDNDGVVSTHSRSIQVGEAPNIPIWLWLIIAAGAVSLLAIVVRGIYRLVKA
ncbi:MAG: glycoside hydrolase domain-containing protein, partial [Dehalococcoidia bacterium]